MQLLLSKRRAAMQEANARIRARVLVDGAVRAKFRAPLTPLGAGAFIHAPPAGSAREGTSHEANLSAESHPPCAQPRISRAHEHRGRTPRALGAPRERSSRAHAGDEEEVAIPISWPNPAARSGGGCGEATFSTSTRLGARRTTRFFIVFVFERGDGGARAPRDHRHPQGRRRGAAQSHQATWCASGFAGGAASSGRATWC